MVLVGGYFLNLLQDYLDLVKPIDLQVNLRNSMDYRQVEGEFSIVVEIQLVLVLRLIPLVEETVDLIIIIVISVKWF